ncbi:MAG TPA: helix-turn-helix transcriptional regulator [Ohtaekwangia sp.]|uniref:helix-turn-helix transcriptional regulator n=1 Tax=Ohtaekwangia sp. TaxID=2066019 RepID=UPI002F924F0E
MTNDTRTVHQGRNVKRFREMLGLKQEALADQLGGDWTQKKISLLENKEIIDEVLLNDLASALKVPAEAIRNFNEETAVNIISNTFTEHAILNGINYNPTFYSIDEALTEIKSLKTEIKELLIRNEKLTEALLKEKDEKISLLQKMLTDKK